MNRNYVTLRKVSQITGNYEFNLVVILLRQTDIHTYTVFLSIVTDDISSFNILMNVRTYNWK